MTSFKDPLKMTVAERAEALRKYHEIYKTRELSEKELEHSVRISNIHNRILYNE